MESASALKSSRDNDLNWTALKAVALVGLSSYRSRFTASASEREKCANKETNEKFSSSDVATDKLKAFFDARLFGFFHGGSQAEWDRDAPSC